jgi:hypothetical protein
MGKEKSKSDPQQISEDGPVELEENKLEQASGGATDGGHAGEIEILSVAAPRPVRKI